MPAYLAPGIARAELDEVSASGMLRRNGLSRPLRRGLAGQQPGHDLDHGGGIDLRSDQCVPPRPNQFPG